MSVETPRLAGFFHGAPFKDFGDVNSSSQRPQSAGMVMMLAWKSKSHPLIKFFTRSKRIGMMLWQFSFLALLAGSNQAKAGTKGGIKSPKETLIARWPSSGCQHVKASLSTSTIKRVIAWIVSQPRGKYGNPMLED
ncbi:hypothetical protein GX51_02022 [Blastomyces parvus]|uniref:Uncharacterized protein n=1 Tax=Blastomyces parvus TaxID=2060905 RepID=A0A2B7XE10_9EURO|nr:hypothetical protein GX51_02022 [Blastomyces parvus]